MYDNNKTEYKSVGISSVMMTCEQTLKLMSTKPGDNTNIEVKMRISDVDSKGTFIYFMVWLNI